MTERAIEKINAEMQKTPDDLYTEILGHYIIDRCGEPGTAEKVLDEQKSLKGAMEAVRGLASKKKSGAVAVLTPAQVFGEIDRYFGFETDRAAQGQAMAAAGAAPVEAPKPKGLALDLADFL